MAHATEHNNSEKEPFEAFGVFFAWTVGLLIACASSFFFFIVAADLYSGHTPSSSILNWEFLVIWSLFPLAYLYLVVRRIFG